MVLFIAQVLHGCGGRISTLALGERGAVEKLRSWGGTLFRKNRNKKTQREKVQSPKGKHMNTLAHGHTTKRAPDFKHTHVAYENGHIFFHRAVVFGWCVPARMGNQNEEGGL